MKKSIILVLLALFIIAPFSQVLAVGTDYRYTGKPLDSSINLYYYGQRYYEPNVGRFTQPDPVSRYLTDPQKLKQSTGQDLQKFLQNPQALNEYNYVQNNPVKYVDPNGEAIQILIPVGIAIFSGIFLNNIKTANSLNVNSTPSTIESRDFGDMVPGWNKIPKAGRLLIGLATGGLASKISGKATKLIDRLATKIDSDLAGSLVKRTHDGFINLYRAVSSAEHEKLMEKGFESFKYITSDIGEAMSYMANKGVDAKLLEIKMPIEIFTKMVESSGLMKGSYGEEFKMMSNSAKEVINKYIIK